MSFISLDFASCRRDFEEFLPGFTMNVFDRNINLDALFTFSQMYVWLRAPRRSLCVGVQMVDTCVCVLQIPVHAAAPEKCVLQPGNVHAGGRHRVLRSRGHPLLPGEDTCCLPQHLGTVGPGSDWGCVIAVPIRPALVIRASAVCGCFGVLQLLSVSTPV